MSFYQALLAHDARTRDVPELHERRALRWTVSLDEQGRLLHVIPHAHAKGDTPYRAVAPREAKARSSGVAPLLLSDNASYVLGLDTAGGKTRKGAFKRAAYLALLHKAAQLPHMETLIRAATQLKAADFPDDLQSGDLIGFQVAGHNPHSWPEYQRWWQQHENTASGAAGNDSVTGDATSLAGNSPLIKGIPGGKALLVMQSTNASSFVRYGLTTLGMGQVTLQACASSLTRLAADRQTSFQPPGCDFMVLHWSSAQEPDPWHDLLSVGQAQLHQVLSGVRPATAHEQGAALHLAIVKGQGSRLMVQDHAQMTLGEAQRHLTRYYAVAGEIKLWELTLAARNDAGTVVPAAVQGLYLHVLLGRPFPAQIRNSLLGQFRRTLTLTAPQRALLALSLEHDMHDPANLPPQLKAAYLLGQYAAQLHELHRRLYPDVALSVTDRLLRALIQQPARVYGKMQAEAETLLLGARRHRPQLTQALTTDLDAFSTQLPLPLPATLTPEQQTVLILGLQAQRRALNDASRARREAWLLAQSSARLDQSSTDASP